MADLISDQELCDETGIKPAYFKRLHSIGAHGDDPIPTAVYEYKKIAIFERASVQNWLIRLYTRGIATFEERLREATRIVEASGGTDGNVHLAAMKSAWTYKDIVTARRSYAQLPIAITEDRQILEKLKAL